MTLRASITSYQMLNLAVYFKSKQYRIKIVKDSGLDPNKNPEHFTMFLSMNHK